MLHGIDVASYQGANPDMSGCDVVAIKVTQGKGYVNPDWESQLKDARDHGAVVVYYQYPEIANGAVADLTHFLDTLGSKLTEDDVLCLDWEWYGQAVSAQQARDYKDLWVATAKNKKQNKAIVYSDLNNWKHVDVNSNCGDGLWIADYGSPEGAPHLTHSWVGHQYADKPMDEDVWNFHDKASMLSWARANFKAPGGGTMADVDAAKVAEIHKVVVESSIKSRVDDVMHTLSEHTAATNAQVYHIADVLQEVLKELAAIKVKVGA